VSSQVRLAIVYLALGTRQTVRLVGTLSPMDDAERARSRRVARSRLVLIVVALAVTALLIVIVVGALRTGTHDEIGQPSLTHAGSADRQADLPDVRIGAVAHQRSTIRRAPSVPRGRVRESRTALRV
jgi:hypothetical protein